MNSWLVLWTDLNPGAIISKVVSLDLQLWENENYLDL